MRACIERVPDGVYRFTSYVDSDGVVNEPLAIALEMTVAGSNITFDFSRSSPPCSGPMNCVWATTQSAVYVAMKHIFPRSPDQCWLLCAAANSGPRADVPLCSVSSPVAGCAAEVAQRIMEAVFGAMGQAMPERMFASPAGTSGNLALGGWDPDRGSGYIMYFFSGGVTAAGGRPMDLPTVALRSAYLKPSRSRSWNSITRCYSRSTRYARLRRSRPPPWRLWHQLPRPHAPRRRKASFLMDHGRTGPPGLMGGTAGATNEIEISQADYVTRPRAHLEGEGYLLRPGDWIQVRTPGGGGYGSRADRDPKLVERDLRRGYFRKEHELPAERDDQSAA